MIRSLHAICLGCVLLLAAHFSPAAAQPAAASQTVFLYVKVHHDSLSLQKSRLVAGALKQRRPERSGDLWYEITSSADQLLAGAWIRKPKALHYDVLQPDGSLTGGIKPVDEEVFVIRVPYRAGLSKISFYKPAGGTGLGKRGDAAAVKGACIASFPIVLEGEAQ